MSEKIYTNVLEVQMNGTKLPDPLARLLISGWADSSMNLPSAFELTFSDPHSDVTTTFSQLAIGAKVQMSVAADGQIGQPLLTGEVTALEADADRNGRTLRVRGYDAAHRLQRNRRVAGYPNMTASDIVRKLATQNTLQVGKIDSTPTVYEMATQPNVTDWDFMSRLALENDVYLYVDRTGKLQFTARRDASGAPADTTTSEKSPYVLQFGANALRCRVGVTSAGQVNTVTVRGWDVPTKRTLTAQVPATKTDGTKIDVTPAEVTTKFGKAALTDSDVPYTTQSQVQHAATALADDVASSFAEMEVAVTGTPELGPGVPVALNGAGRPFEGKYTVTSARHVFESGQQYLTWVEVTGRQIRSLYGLASGGGQSAPVMPSMANALVSNVKDPTKQGRVKVKFPWLSDTYESGWCRVAQFGGVRGGGSVLPEVNDEVLVGFDRGSLEHPYVLAGLYNGVDRPTPDPNRLDQVDGVSGAVNWRSMASRSGHTVELLDAKTKATTGIRMRTGNGALTMYLDQTKTTITVDSKGAVSIKGTVSVSIEAGGDLSLKGGGAVNIDAGGVLSLKAGGDVALNAVGAATINAVGTVTMNSAGPVEVGSVSAITINAPAVALDGGVLANGVPVI
jgi:phage protein D